MNHQNHYKKPLFRNWVKGCLAYRHLRDGIESFADEVVKKEHTRLLQLVKYNHGNICSQCSFQILKPKHEKEKDSETGKYHCPWSQKRCNCLLSNKQVCPANICDEILEEIIKCHARSPPEPNWKNTHMCDWCRNPWEVAKCFINAPGYIDKTTVTEIDIAGLLHVFINNKMLQSHLKCSDVFSKALRRRNKLFHSTSMELNQPDLIESTDDMIALLEDEKELKEKQDSIKAVHILNQIKIGDICITMQDEFEVFNESIKSINNQIQDIKESNSPGSPITLDDELSEKLDKLSTKVETLESDIADINKRLGDMESLRSRQQQNLEYISHKQELQKILLRRYREDHVKTWISPLSTRINNIDINVVYVPPKMFIEKQFGKMTECETDLKPIENYHDIFCASEDHASENQGQNISRNTPFYKCYKHSNICILGEIGTGKSALCKKMIYSWCHSITGNEHKSIDLHEMSKFEFLFYVQMCSFPENCFDIRGMIKRSLDNEYDGLVEEIFNRDPERCLVLIDGLDEWCIHLHGKPNLVQGQTTYGIPASNTVRGASIITTSRPSAPGVLNMKCTDYDRIIRLVGIDENKLQHMAELYINAMNTGLKQPATAEDFMKKLQSSQFQHPEKTPLLLQQVLWMYWKNDMIYESVSAIHIHFVNIKFAWLEEKGQDVIEETQHVSDEVKTLHLPLSLSRFERYLNNQQLVFVLGTIAFRTLVSLTTTHKFGQSILKECNINDETMSMYLKTGLIVKENCFDPTLERTQFSFTHIAYRDFFAAVYIASQFSTEMIPNTKLHELFEREDFAMRDISQLSNLMIIVCGLNPSMITHTSEIVYDIVKRDRQREDYIEDIIYGKGVKPELMEQTKKIQDLLSNMLYECDFSDILPRVSVCDIIVQKETNLDLVRQVCPETVKSMNIDRHCLDEEVVRVIQKLIHLRTLVIKNRENERSCMAISPLITKANSLLELIFYNDNLSLDLSLHENLKDIALDRCEHISISSVNITLLHTCEIKGLHLPHEHFDILSTSFAKAVGLNTLTLTDITCERIGCSGHNLDLYENENIHFFTLEDCDSISFSISSSGALKSCAIHRCIFTHTQMEELMSSITKLASLNSLKLNSVKGNASCEGSCEGHSFNLSGHKFLDTLSLEKCNRVGAFGDTGVPVKSCVFRQCTFLHDQCSEISSLLERSDSLTDVALSENKCDFAICKGHRINLCQHKQLQTLRSTDICMFPYKMNCVRLRKIDRYICKPMIGVPDGMKDSTFLEEFKIEAVSKKTLYTKQINSVLHTFKHLKIIQLRRVKMEDTPLTVSPDMENLTNIDLWVVEMTQNTWSEFVKSLINMKRGILIRTITLELTTGKNNVHAVVKVDTDNFEVSYVKGFELSFQLKMKRPNLD